MPPSIAMQGGKGKKDLITLQTPELASPLETALILSAG